MGIQKKVFFTVTIRDEACKTGTYLLLESWGAKRLDSIRHSGKSLDVVAKAKEATLPEFRPHQFSPNKGVVGILVISESHINIPTWPEFVCNIKYHDSKMHFCSFVLPSFIMN